MLLSPKWKSSMRPIADKALILTLISRMENRNVQPAQVQDQQTRIRACQHLNEVSHAIEMASQSACQ